MTLPTGVIPTEKQQAIDGLRAMADALEEGKATYVDSLIRTEPLEKPCCVYKEHANRNMPKTITYTVSVLIG